MSEWISVKDRLPQVIDDYLVAIQTGIAIFRDVRSFSDGRFIGVGGGDKVTHWMPLPDPPKETAMTEPANRISEERLGELICIADDDPGDDNEGRDMMFALRELLAIRASHAECVKALEDLLASSQRKSEYNNYRGLIFVHSCNNARAALANARKLME